MKKLFGFLSIFMILFFMNNTAYAFYETLPKDIGSNSQIMEIINPIEKETVSYSDTYIVSCIAEPGTEITLYEKYDDTLYVPMLLDNEAMTGKVGESGLFLVTLTFKVNSKNRIMFFAQNGSKYQTVFKVISVEEKEEEEKIDYKIVNIKDFIVTEL